MRALWRMPLMKSGMRMFSLGAWTRLCGWPQPDVTTGSPSTWMNGCSGPLLRVYAEAPNDVRVRALLDFGEAIAAAEK